MISDILQEIRPLTKSFYDRFTKNEAITSFRYVTSLSKQVSHSQLAFYSKSRSDLYWYSAAK